MFRPELVRAILSGAKNQTRRVVKPSPGEQSKWLTMDLIAKVPHGEMIDGGWQMHHPKAGTRADGVDVAHDSPLGWIRCPYGAPGDRLVVIEVREIHGCDGCLAGDDGRIYSEREASTNARKELPFALESTKSDNGYEYVTISGPSTRRRSRSVHSLVCAAFHVRPAGAREVRHLDGDRRNNSPQNLCWGTRAENEADKRRHGSAAVGERHGNAGLSDADADLIRRSVSSGLVTTNRAAEFFGILPATVRAIVGGRSRAAVVGEIGTALPDSARALTIEITRVRAERLQAITEEDARAEGFENEIPPGFSGLTGARASFADAWDRVNAKRPGCGWADNPWTWVIDFKRSNA